MKGSTQSSGSSQGLVQATSLDELTLVIVHANDKHNPDLAGINNIQTLVDSGIASTIYEHKAHNSSRVHHRGVIIDNEENPGYYLLPGIFSSLPSKSSDIILVGGGIGNCHFGAYLAIMSQLYNKPKSIHLPLDCIYETVVKDSDDGKYLASSTVGLRHPALNKYMGLVKMCSDHHSIQKDNVVMDSYEGQRQTTLLIWSTSDKLVDYLNQQR